METVGFMRVKFSKDLITKLENASKYGISYPYLPIYTEHYYIGH